MIELGDLGAAREKLRGLPAERERVARELAWRIAPSGRSRARARRPVSSAFDRKREHGTAVLGRLLAGCRMTARTEAEGDFRVEGLFELPLRNDECPVS